MTASWRQPRKPSLYVCRGCHSLLERVEGIGHADLFRHVNGDYEGATWCGPDAQLAAPADMDDDYPLGEVTA